MPRITLADVQNPKLSNIAANVGMTPATNDFIALINEAQQRLMFEGRWWGTCARFTICAFNGCLTLPRQIATIEAVAVCGRPIPLRDFWYEFLENGMGIRSNQSCWPEAVARGNFPTITEISGVTSKLNAICDLTADAGQQILALGYDQNGNWIRTLQNGAYADGEVITLSVSPGTKSVNLFSRVTDLQMTGEMSGQWWLYAYDTNTAIQTLLGNYQHDETRPSYARYFFPSVAALTGVSGSKPVQIDAIGKKEFIPAQQPTDYLIIGNIPALNEMCMAINKAGNEADGVKSNQILQSGLMAAIRLLNGELDMYLGSGRRIGITLSGSSVGEQFPVENFI